MNQMIEIKYTIAAEIEYPKGEIILIADTRHETFDINGNPIQVYYKQQKLPYPNVTIGNVTKSMKEINEKWLEDNNRMVWGIFMDGDIRCLGIKEEKFDPNHAISFIALCERFIKEVFHL